MSYERIANNMILSTCDVRYIGMRDPQAKCGISPMRYLIALFLGVLLLQSIGLAYADFDDGMTAYKRGDYHGALKEFTALAEQGDANAQAMLGSLYGSGRGVPKNYVKALKWALLAADQGHAEAQLNLAMMHAFGLGGLEIDAVEAYKWATIAANNGVEEAVEFRKYIEGGMEPREIETAQDRIGECVKSNYKACDIELPETNKITQDRVSGDDQAHTGGVSLLDQAKIDCEELGFAPKTEAFGNCVLKLMD